MTIDTLESGSPGWWILRLVRLLEQRQLRLERLAAYYRGDPPSPFGVDGLRPDFLEFIKRSRTNFAQLVVEAPRERMNVVGFRTGAAGDDLGDVAARQIWDSNQLNVEQADVHADMLALGDGYVIVAPAEDEGGFPVITGESPLQVITVHDPARPRLVRAAVKLYHDDDDERDYAYLYLPGRVHVATKASARRGVVARFSPGSWEWDADRGGVAGQEVLGGQGLVPVVRFKNRRGVGEFEEHTDVLDRINHEVYKRMIVGAAQAFRQRALQGAPSVDEDGNDIDYTGLLVNDPDGAWVIPEGTIWESGQVDLSPLINSAKTDVTFLSGVTRTPMNYLFPDAANQSAEGAAVTREGLVFKTRDRMARATEAWKDVMSLAFLLDGDEERSDRSQLSVLWAPIETESLAERFDAASKAATAGVPWRTVMTDVLKFSLGDVERMEADRATDALLAPPAPSFGVPAAMTPAAMIPAANGAPRGPAL